MELDVIVVGAGLSGLSAAKLLLESGINVVVLEATGRLGGRTLTVKNSNVDYVDMGAAYIGPTQNRILRLIREFGIENYRINVEGDLLHYKNGRRTRFCSGDLPSRINPLINMDINNILWMIDEMGKEIPNEAPWKAPKANEWDTMTLKEFLQKSCWTNAAIEHFKNFIALDMTSEAYEVSLLGFLWYIKQCGGTKRIDSTTNGAQERKVIGGTQQICECLARSLGNDGVILDSPVAAVFQDDQTVIVKTLNNLQFKAKYVILACPPAIFSKIHFAPPLPPLKNQMMQRIPMGRIIKLVLYYSRAFWRENGLCGAFYIEGGEEYPAFWVQEDTKPDGSYPAVVGFIAGDKCTEVLEKTQEERKVQLAESITKATGLYEFLNPIHYEEKNWMEEQYCGGGYTAMYPPGMFITYGKVLREPVGRIYFAGTETATEWSGYMEGAIEAGERAAREVLCDMGKITKNMVWQEEPLDENVIPQEFNTTYYEKYAPSVPQFFGLISFTLLVSGVALLLIKRQYFSKF